MNTLASTLASRPNIRDDLVVEVRQRIFDGRLPEGDRINEVHLSAALGISRTPLREALNVLAAEHAVVAIPRRGFFVRDFDAAEFRDIYPIRAILDVEALRLSGIPSTERLQRLQDLNDRLKRARGVEARIDLDDQWHLELVADCDNGVMLDLIRQFQRRTRRYEMAYLRETHHVSTAYQEHQKVQAALRKKDLPQACRALKQNLTSGLQPILDWLRERKQQGDSR